MAHSLLAGDPSLRLKNGSARDDAVTTTTVGSGFKLRNYSGSLLSVADGAQKGERMGMILSPQKSVLFDLQMIVNRKDAGHTVGAHSGEVLVGIGIDHAFECHVAAFDDNSDRLLHAQCVLF